MSKQIERLLRRVAALRPQISDASAVAQAQVVRMKERTSNGISLDGSHFIPKKDGSPSRLYKTGRLMNGLTAAVVTLADGSVRVRVYVEGPAAAYAPFVNAKRPFMGFSDGERMVMNAEIRRNIMERVRRA